MVLATLIFCLASNPASRPVRKQFRVERRACTLGPYQAEIPSKGRWVKAIVKIACH